MKDKKKTTALLVFLSVLIIFSIIITFGSILAFTYKNRYYSRTKISNIDIGSKTKTEATKIIEQKNKEYLETTSLKLSYSEKEQSIPSSLISANLNGQKSLDEVFAKTHRSFFFSIFESLDSLVFGSNWSQEVSIDKNQLSDILGQLAGESLIKPEDASLEIIDNSIIFNEAKYGEGPDVEQAYETTKEKVAFLENDVIKIEKTKLKPEISDIDLAQAYFKTSFLLQNEGFNLKKGSSIIYSIDDRDLKDWLKFEKKTYASFVDTGMFQGRVAGVSISTKDGAGVFVMPQLIRNNNVLEAYIDTTKIKDFVAVLASKINKKPENAKLAIVSGALTVIKKENYGQELDQNKLIEEINLRLNSSSEKDIELPVLELIPEVRADNISELGIKEKIAEGISSFAGSPKNRINNLTIGASKFNGAIIKPDAVASFAEIVGSVEPSDGYLPELVIKGKQTIQEYGGGMCQVSTTFYRAALNAGVPILERHAHAYLVGYYKDGPDATVYVPSTDLKWKNDTGHYIFVQTKVDPASKKMTFELWGTADGRKVTISPPTFTDPVPAPTEPYYVDDPAYPTGYLAEEEHAHEGVTGTIIRTITYPDGKIKTDTIKSTYKPWPAKIRRGIGPADLPIPSPTP